MCFLGDFGHATEKDTKHTKAAGTPLYAAPEMLQSSKKFPYWVIVPVQQPFFVLFLSLNWQGPAVDMFSLGIMFYVLLTFKFPWPQAAIPPREIDVEVYNQWCAWADSK